MPIKVTCSSCSGVLHAPDDAAGKRGRCPTCGMILTIPADGPRVAAEPPPAAPTFGFPQPAEPQAVPRPPAIGDDAAKSSYGLGRAMTESPTGPVAGKLPPPDPRRYGDPFAKPGKPPQDASTDARSRKWSSVHRGLGFLRWGLVFFVLAILLPLGLSALEANNVRLPDRDPGLLNLRGLSQANEIKVAASLVCLLIGGLLFLLGRFRIGGVPHETGARSIARAAAFGTLLSFFGFAVYALFAISATFEQAPPKLLPAERVVPPANKLPTRVQAYADVEEYVRELQNDSHDFPGQAQRFGLLAFVVAGIIAELWFLGALSRLAGYLRSPQSARLINGSSILLGSLVLIAAFAWLAYDLYGREWVNQNVLPRWNGYTPGIRAAISAGIVAVVVLLLAGLYGRSLGGLRRAIREQHG